MSRSEMRQVRPQLLRCVCAPHGAPFSASPRRLCHTLPMGGVHQDGEEALRVSLLTQGAPRRGTAVCRDEGPGRSGAAVPMGAARRGACFAVNICAVFGMQTPCCLCRGAPLCALLIFYPALRCGAPPCASDW